MLVSEVYNLSILPPGGSPEVDAIYEGWLVDFVRSVNQRWLDHHTANRLELPSRDLLRRYGVTGHLAKYLNGGKPIVDGHGMNHQHRIRFVSVQFRYRRDELISEARRYACECAKRELMQ